MSPRSLAITGASRGLGRALAERFLEQGHRVAVCARSEDALEELRAAHGERVHVAAVDVASAAEVEDWTRAVLEDLGAPDLLVNNAALMNDPAPLWEVPADEFERMTAVNVNGTANVVRSFVPAMIAAGRGVVVNLSSGWGRSTSPEVGPYCATKWAVEGFTKSLAQELPAGLAAVSLNPGVIDTAMLRQCWSDAASAYEDADTWSLRAAPFLLGISSEQNGAALTVP